MLLQLRSIYLFLISVVHDVESMALRVRKQIQIVSLGFIHAMFLNRSENNVSYAID